jgi:hypothetical protein
LGGLGNVDDRREVVVQVLQIVLCHARSMCGIAANVESRNTVSQTVDRN